ncbi:hypothetical protein [Reichenbachiella sp.]|uniref:hypothetical protein n=1 Tax=Reichenbachiella sp. TaxID=2184521 RepID=UPI003B5B8520
MVEKRNITKEEWLINTCDNPIDDRKIKENIRKGHTNIESFLSSKWYEYEMLSLKAYFIDKNIELTKQYLFECGMLDEIVINKYKGRILEYGMAHISYAL